MKHKIIDFQFLIQQTKKFNRAEDFIWSVKKTNANELLYEWDIVQNKKFKLDKIDNKKRPTRGWFDIARDFYHQQRSDINK